MLCFAKQEARALLVLALALGGLASCALIVDFETKGAGAGDAGCNGAACNGDGAADGSDAGADVTDAAGATTCCGCVFDPLNAGSLGDSGSPFLVRIADGVSLGAEYLTLTTDSRSVGGGVLWRAPADLTNFEVSFEAAIVSKDPTAAGDGIAFVALASAPDSTKGCASGVNFCVLANDPDGFALLWRTHARSDV